MIINTVILFLRDLLPLFILYCYLSVIFEAKINNKKLWLPSIILGCFLAMLFTYTAQDIGEWQEGAGIEIFRTILLGFMFCSLTLAIYITSTINQISQKQSLLIIVGCSVFIVEKGSSFLLFLNVYIQQVDNFYNTLIGCFVGLGICTSFSILFRFTLKELISNRCFYLVIILWCLFITGQVSGTLHYLSQVDLLTTSPTVINLTHFVNDSSEVGHMLNALLGYESSPSLSFVLFYIVVFLVSFLFSHKRFKHPSTFTEKSRVI